MAFVYMHIFFADFLCFDMSLLLLTVTLRGVSNKHCLLSLFSFSATQTLGAITLKSEQSNLNVNKCLQKKQTDWR